MHWLFLFEDTPLPPDPPLKALTSLGKRFDVACRMLLAAVQSPADKATCFFRSDADVGEISTVVLDIDGSTFEEGGAPRSEIAIARWLGDAMKHAGGEKKTIPGVLVSTIAAMPPAHAFMERVSRAKESGLEIIVLHENGVPCLEVSKRNGLEATTSISPSEECLSRNPGNERLYIVGNHAGFAAEIETELLGMADGVFCLSTPGSEREGEKDGTPSYLGSQVILAFRAAIGESPPVAR